MQALFYVLTQANEPSSHLPAHFDLGAKLAAQQYRAGKRVFIYIDNQQDAHLIDQHLWEFDADSFVPHNLQGEGPRAGAPVEIGNMPPVAQRSVLINLATALPDFIRRFEQVFDFVPLDETAKQAGRERFKQLKALGVQPQTQQIDS